MVSAYQAEMEKLRQKKGRQLTGKEMDETIEKVKTEFQKKSAAKKEKLLKEKNLKLPPGRNKWLKYLFQRIRLTDVFGLIGY